MHCGELELWRIRYWRGLRLGGSQVSQWSPYVNHRLSTRVGPLINLFWSEESAQGYHCSVIIQVFLSIQNSDLWHFHFLSVTSPDRGVTKGVVQGTAGAHTESWHPLRTDWIETWRRGVTGICGCMAKTLLADTRFCGSWEKPSQSASCWCRGGCTLWPPAHQSYPTVIFSQCSIDADSEGREAGTRFVTYLCCLCICFCFFNVCK